jgi:transcriptional/translational regulatory protein YebC/TACO1
MERAFICVKTEPSSVERVLENIKAANGVEFANMVFGAYDVCFGVKEENLEKLKALTEKITKNNDVRATLTLFGSG